MKPLLFPNRNESEVITAILANPEMASLLQEIEAHAQKLEGKPLEVLPWHLFVQYELTGNRIAYEAVYFERRGRLMTFALQSWLYRRPEDLTRLEEVIWAICEESTWVLPAHMPPLETVYGELGSDLQMPIDLFAAETAFALAEMDYLLGEVLNPVVHSRIHNEVMNRVLMPFLEAEKPYSWELSSNNWCAVCGGAIGSASLYIIKDALQLKKMLQKLMPTFEKFINSFEADGTCLEGLGYWTYGVSFYVAFADLLKHHTKGQLDLLSDEKFEKIATFQQKCYFAGGWSVSFSDTQEKERYRRGLTHYLDERFQVVELPEATSQAGYHWDACYRWCNGFRDLLWGLTSAHAENKYQNSYMKENNHGTSPWRILPEAQWFMCQHQAGSKYGLAIKGGHNQEPHNHNDVGAFVWYKEEMCILTDLGAGEYTRAYFGDQRYEILCNRSKGHSVPILKNQEQEAGVSFCATEVSFDGEKEVVTMNLAEAYQVGALKSFIRSVTCEERAGVRLLDTYEVTLLPFKIVERFVTHYPPVIKAGVIEIIAGDVVGYLAYEQDQVMPTIQHEKHMDHEGHMKNVYCIDFEGKVTRQKGQCLFRFY